MRKLKAILCVLLCMCTATMSAVVAFAADDDINALEQKRLELEAENEKYQTILDKTKENIESQEEYNEALVAKIEVMDDKIEISHQKISELNSDIETKTTEIEEANKKIETQMETLRNRIRKIYMAGNVTDIEIILGAKDFSDFLDKMELVKTLSEYDENLIDKIQVELEKISTEKAELEESKAELEVEQATLESDQEELNTLLEENKTLLASLYTASEEASEALEHGALESEEVENAIAEYYAEKARIAAELEEKRRLEAEKNSQNSSGSSNSSSGSSDYTDIEISASGFTWPCPGYYYLSSEWNEDRTTYNHGAIDIAGSGIMGADVVAASSGTVISSYSGCPHNWGKNGSCGCGGGYGNYVMIDHGNGKMTVYAHLSSVMVYTNQTVYTGQVIGFVGSTGESTGAHLHFETRLNGVKYNPMLEF